MIGVNSASSGMSHTHARHALGSNLAISDSERHGRDNFKGDAATTGYRSHNTHVVDDWLAQISTVGSNGKQLGACTWTTWHTVWTPLPEVELARLHLFWGSKFVKIYVGQTGAPEKFPLFSPGTNFRHTRGKFYTTILAIFDRIQGFHGTVPKEVVADNKLAIHPKAFIVVKTYIFE